MGDRKKMTSTFALGQICKGEGLVFEVVGFEPLRVRCLENSGRWCPEKYGIYRDSVTWKVGQEYELYFGSEAAGRNWNFSIPQLPWCSIYESGKVEHYR